MKIIKSNLKFKPLGYRKITNEIILHHAQWKNASVEQIHNDHVINKGWSGIGYHFYVRKNGVVYEGRPLSAVGAHALGHNSTSVGICCEGDFMVENMCDIQMQAVRDTISYVKSIYGNISVKRHKDVNSTDCPGTNYRYNEIISNVKVETPYPIINGIVTANVLNVRDGSGTNYPILGTLKKGDKVKIDKRYGQGEWYSIYYGSHGGFVHQKYIKII